MFMIFVFSPLRSSLFIFLPSRSFLNNLFQPQFLLLMIVILVLPPRMTFFVVFLVTLRNYKIMKILLKLLFSMKKILSSVIKTL